MGNERLAECETETKRYRIYTDKDIRRLKTIRCLRCANYSLEAILQMLKQLSENPNLEIKKALEIPKENTDILTAYDRLISSLAAEENAGQILGMLQEMKLRFLQPSTLPTVF